MRNGYSGTRACSTPCRAFCGDGTFSGKYRGQRVSTTTNSTDFIEGLRDAASPGPWHPADRGVGWEVHLGEAPEECWTQAPDCPEFNSGFRQTTTEGNAKLAAEAPRMAASLLLMASALELVIDCGEECVCEDDGDDTCLADVVNAALASIPQEAPHE